MLIVSMCIALFVRQQARFDGGVAGAHLVGVGLAALRELFGQRRVLHGEDLRGQRAALAAPSIATVATGMPVGI